MCLKPFVLCLCLDDTINRSPRRKTVARQIPTLFVLKTLIIVPYCYRLEDFIFFFLLFFYGNSFITPISIIIGETKTLSSYISRISRDVNTKI